MDVAAPKVTVLMRVYNAERYIRESIESVLQQTFTDLELLVLDDCSTDASPAIASSFLDNRIRIVRNQTHEGAACAAKKALQLAKGEYVAVLDADDVALNQRLQVEVSYLDGNPGVVLVASSCETVNEDGVILGIWPCSLDWLTIRWKLLFGNCVGAHSSVMFRRDRALVAGGYDDQVIAGHDFDLYVRLAAYGTIVQINQPLVQLRMHSQSFTQTIPVSVKDHYIRTVMRSIRLHARQDVTFEVARCLFTDIPRPCTNVAVLAAACSTIRRCLVSLASSAHVTQEGRRRLAGLAISELLRIGDLNVRSCPRGCQLALIHALRVDPSVALSWSFIRTALRSVAPPSLSHFYRAIRESIAYRLSDPERREGQTRIEVTSSRIETAGGNSVRE